MKRVLRILWMTGLILSLAAALQAVPFQRKTGIRCGILEFQTVPSEELPEELSKLISEKVSQPFKLTYTDDKNLYIAVGYGAQPTGGYSISIRELYLTENSIVLATELMGPEKGEDPGTEKSFPYIVLRTELLEEPVIFK